MIMAIETFFAPTGLLRGTVFLLVLILSLFIASRMSAKFEALYAGSMHGFGWPSDQLAKHMKWTFKRLEDTGYHLSGKVRATNFTMTSSQGVRTLVFHLQDVKQEAPLLRDFEELALAELLQENMARGWQFPSTLNVLKDCVGSPLGAAPILRVRASEIAIQTTPLTEKGIRPGVAIDRRMREAQTILNLVDAIEADLKRLNNSG